MANTFGNTAARNNVYTSFAGNDITAVIGGKTVGSLQGVSYSVTREKGPIYVMNGQADPRGFARGKRAIAGTLIFITFDEQAFLSHMEQTDGGEGAKFYANKADIRYEYGGANPDDVFGLFEQAVAENIGGAGEFADLAPDGAGSERTWQKAWYADQILPFDVNISAANESGKAMKKSFIGVEILNEGGGVSVDDMVLEEQYTFLARGLTKWTKTMKNFQQKV